MLSAPLPTQCFFDSVLVPLPAWIYFALLLLLGVVGATRKAKPPYAPISPMVRARPTARWLRVTTLVLYYFFIAVVVLMQTVELARLVQIEYGVGLLPFVYAGCVVAAAMQATRGFGGRLPGWQVAGLVFWAAGFVMAVLKLAALNKIGTEGPYARNDGSYPTIHQITDIVILVAFYPLTFCVELALLFQAPWKRSTGDGHTAADGENKNIVV